MAITRRGLGEGVGAIRRLAKEAQLRIASTFAEYVRKELRAQHVQGRNVYGKRFPAPRSGGAPMLDSGLLMDGYDVVVVDEGRRVRVGQHVYYSKFLNGDGEHEHLPTSGLPEKWQRKLDEIKKAELKRFLKEVKRALNM